MSWKVKGQEIAVPHKAAPSRSTSFINLKIIAPAFTSFLQLFVWGAVSAFFPLYAIQCGVNKSGTLLYRHGHNDGRREALWRENYGHLQ